MVYKSDLGISNILRSSQVAQMSKPSACRAGDLGSTPGLGRSPEEGNGNSIAWKVPWTEEPAGYSIWGHKESDTTERLQFPFLV